MLPKLQLIALLILSALILVSGEPTRAVVEEGTGNNIIAKIEPPAPKPGEMVKISLSGYGVDLDRAYFRWFKDTKAVTKGFGEKTFSFQAGQLGQRTTINVLISYNSRLIAEKSFIFEPADLKIGWQANSLVPPFYQGKARASAGATIRIAAEPRLADNQGRIRTNDQLIYRWTINDKTLTADSGLGRNTIVIKTEPTDRVLKVNLVVETLDKKQNATETLILNLTRPRIAFYTREPLTGTNFAQPIATTYNLTEEEVILQALPLFWPFEDLNQLSYHWQVNNTKVSSPSGHPELLVVRRPASASGQSEIKLELKSRIDNQTQDTGRFNIKFGNDLLEFD